MTRTTRSRASWRIEHDGGERPTCPFAAPHRWDVDPAGLRLEVGPTSDTAAVTIPTGPTLLTGGPACGARSTLDALEAAAAVRRPVARVVATPGAPLPAALHTALRAAGDRGETTDAVRQALDDVGRDGADTARLTASLAVLAAEAAERGAGLVLLVDDLHAASRRESEALLAAVAAVAEQEPSFRAVATVSHPSTVGVERDTRAAWATVPLTVTVPVLAALVDRVELTHGRRFADDAVAELVRAGSGAAAFVLAHAAAAWDSTRGEVITVGQVREAAPRAATANGADLRRAWTGRLSIGQRRCLRAIAQDGGRGVDLDEVARRLGNGARFGVSGGMLDTMLTSLVQRGLLIVHDGTAELAIPGLAAIL